MTITVEISERKLVKKINEKNINNCNIFASFIMVKSNTVERIVFEDMRYYEQF